MLYSGSVMRFDNSISFPHFHYHNVRVSMIAASTLQKTLWRTGADPEFWNGGGYRSSAECASIEAPQAPRGGGLFLTFWLGMVHFGDYSDKNSQFTRPIQVKMHLSDR